ncbi:N-acetyltransferase [Pseudomethylobacillus aquaticus]|uniref:N-acetyltransferase n=1 Tax=Pseudomethylobacillus aquaticus TaxID=2676064 RepID=A0A3N0V6Z4_9PROT|nr:N-acetyltransferase [Pseudomethylobacillus aquaticus]ROH88374.1 N-acetyltransferase [Pseudomethylobacillus aquaticus]
MTSSPPHISWRIATHADTPAIVTLVNSAYRGDASRAGWTTEADLLDGQRTEADEISELIAAADSLFILGFAQHSLCASAHLKRDPVGAYLGMVVVNPQLQARGIGRALIAECERLAQQQWQANTMRMTVITLRETLIAYYQRLGYQRTGILHAFPRDPRFGIAKVEGLVLEELRKPLADQAHLQQTS